jgi:hypothetical protein
MVPEPVSLVWLLEKAWVLLVAVVWYIKKGTDKDNQKRDDSISKVELDLISVSSKYVTEAQMKETIREALEPYKEDQQEIKLLLRELNDQIFALSKEVAVQSALRNLNQ